ncbi:MAG: diguanylate cyclase [Spirochaetota bacterium]|nr:diguanylate cyclase [Spirochaetota bacterium]
MGLLEKAMQYKKDMNSVGAETLADNNNLPTETNFVEDEMIHNNNGLNDSIDFGNREDINGGDEFLINDEDSLDVGFESDPITASQEENGKTLSEIEEVKTGIDDELFQLPDDDDQSLKEALNEQKSKKQESVIDSSVEEGIVNSKTDGGIKEDDFKPLGPEDEPIIADMKEGVTEGADDVESDKIDIDRDVDVGLDDILKEESIIAGELSEAVYPDTMDSGVAFDDIDAGAKSPPTCYRDYQALYEFQKEIEKMGSRRELFDLILFLVMGQIAISSSSIISIDLNDEKRWTLTCSKGIKPNEENVAFDFTEGIVNELRRGIVDIEEYKDNVEFRELYYQLTSIDARLLVPIVDNDNLYGTLIVGEKLNTLDYTEGERDFILSVCNSSAIALSRMNVIEDLVSQNAIYKNDIDVIQYIDNFHEKVVNVNSIKELEEIVISEFEKLSIVCFGVFIKDERDEDYVPIIVEREDLLSLNESNFRIKGDNPFIEYVQKIRHNERLKDFDRLKDIHNLFGESRLKKMSILWIYPFKIGIHLIGFITIFDILDKNRDCEIEKKLSRFSKIIFHYILNIRSYDIHESMYVDNVEILLKRINQELQKAKDLQIPLTLVLFSIKNFKRYHNVFGYNEAKKMIDSLIEVIKSRLGEDDFSVRLARHKILIVLPGKDKKYAIPFANVIRNEITKGFKKKEMQLLITFLTSEYPEDGDDLYTLLDCID